MTVAATPWAQTVLGGANGWIETPRRKPKAKRHRPRAPRRAKPKAKRRRKGTPADEHMACLLIEIRGELVRVINGEPRRFPQHAECDHLDPGRPCRNWRCRYSLIPQYLRMPEDVAGSADPLRSIELAGLPRIRTAPRWFEGGDVEYLSRWPKADRSELVDAISVSHAPTCAIAAAGQRPWSREELGVLWHRHAESIRRYEEEALGSLPASLKEHWECE